MGSALAVDFGTATTVAVVRHGDGRTETVLFDGAPTLPSAVFAQPGKGLLTGLDALASGKAAPERFEPHPKLRVDDEAVWLGSEVTVVDMIAAVLRRAARGALRVLGEPFDHVVLTCPAAWDATRREVLSGAAVRAGLSPVTLVPEPVAAARHFTGPDAGPVAVYDFGAGGFEVSVVGGDRVLAADGLGDLGGLDIDAAIVDMLDATIEADDSGRGAWSRLRSPRGLDDRRAWRRFAEDVRTAKEMLSRSERALLRIPLVERDVPLRRDRLEQIAEPLIRRTVATTRAAMTTAGLDGAAGVYVVGGASRMPLVTAMLERILGITPVAADRPEQAVAYGALEFAVDRPRTAAERPGDQTARARLLTRAAGSMRALASDRARPIPAPAEAEPPPLAAAAVVPRQAGSAVAAGVPRTDVWLLLGLLAAVTVGAIGVVVLLWNVSSS